MTLNLHIADAKQKLTKYHKTISSAFELAAKNAKQNLGAHGIDVVVNHNPEWVIPEIGVGGNTLQNGLVMIYVDADKGFKKEDLTGTMLHEIFHAVRFSRVKVGPTLLDALVHEGLATLYETETTKHPPIYASVKLDEKIIAKAKTEYASTTYSFNDWFLGTSKNIPKWAGYTLGYQICKKLALSKHLQASELLAANVNELQ